MTYRLARSGAIILVGIVTMLAGSLPTASASGMTSCPSGYKMVTLSSVPASEYGEASGADQNNNGIVCRDSVWFFYEWYWYEDDQ